LTLLIVSYVDVSYNRTSNCMLKWFLSTSEEKDYAWIGFCTLPSEGLFKLFVEGRRVHGKPSKLKIKLTPREARIFTLITKAGFEKKRNIWADFTSGKVDKPAMLTRLEEECPIWILRKKLSNERTSN